MHCISRLLPRMCTSAIRKENADGKNNSIIRSPQQKRRFEEAVESRKKKKNARNRFYATYSFENDRSVFIAREMEISIVHLHH